MVEPLAVRHPASQSVELSILIWTTGVKGSLNPLKSMDLFPSQVLSKNQVYFSISHVMNNSYTRSIKQGNKKLYVIEKKNTRANSLL